MFVPPAVDAELGREFFAEPGWGELFASVLKKRGCNGKDILDDSGMGLRGL